MNHWTKISRMLLALLLLAGTMQGADKPEKPEKTKVATDDGT